MKEKLSLMKLNEMNEKEINGIKGGSDTCGCSCYYSGQPGGSSSDDNGCANYNLGFMSKKGVNYEYICVYPPKKK
jgi:natural product precursor